MKIDRPDGRHRPDGTETMVFSGVFPGRDFPLALAALARDLEEAFGGPDE